MNGRHVSMFMMTVTIAYSAPLQYEYETVEATSTNKPILRRHVETPGKCCSDKAQRCCPYDYDDHCEAADDRNLCGYNKNLKYPDQIETLFTKFGLPCRINDDRVECGYKGPYVTDNINPMPNPTGNPDGCCHCCDQQTTEETIDKVTFTDATPETTRETTKLTSTAAIEATEPSMESSEEITVGTETNSPRKLIMTSKTTPGPPVTKCQTVEEECRVVFEQPCIMDAPCGNDYPEWKDKQ